MCSMREAPSSETSTQKDRWSFLRRDQAGQTDEAAGARMARTDFVKHLKRKQEPNFNHLRS